MISCVQNYSNMQRRFYCAFKNQVPAPLPELLPTDTVSSLAFSRMPCKRKQTGDLFFLGAGDQTPKLRFTGRCWAAELNPGHSLFLFSDRLSMLSSYAVRTGPLLSVACWGFLSTAWLVSGHTDVPLFIHSPAVRYFNSLVSAVTSQDV